MAQITGKINLDISNVISGVADANKIVNKFISNIDSISDVDVKFKTDGLENSNKDVENFNENVKKIPTEKKVKVQTETDTQSTKEFIKQLDSIVLQKKQALIQSDLELKNQLRSNALLESRKLNDNELLQLSKKQLASSNEIKNTIEETYKITKNKGIIEFGVNIDEKTKDKVLNQLQNIEVDIKFNQAAIDKAEASIKEISDLKQIEIDFDKSSIDKISSEISSIANKVDVKVDADYDSIGKAKNEIKGLPNKADVTINADTSKVQTQIDKLKESLKGLGGDSGGGLIDTFKEGGVLGVGIAAATAGITALTGAIGSFISGGFELNSAFLDLENRTKQFGFNVNELKDGAKEAFVGGVGGSVAEAAQIIGRAAVTLKGVFDPKELTTFVIGAQALGNAYDKDVNEVIMKSEPFIKQFGLSGKEAFDLLSLSLRDAGTAQDDVLDSLAEYSQLAVQAGFSAEGFVNALTVGAKEGVFNTDKIADALKETQIRLKAGDTQKALKDFTTKIPQGLLNTIKSTEQLARSGAISVEDYLRKSTASIQNSFDAGEISESLRTQLQIAIAGTPAEDLGSDIFTKIFTAPIDEKLIQQRAAEAGQLISNTTGQYTNFEQITKRIDTFIQDLSAAFVGFADKTLAPIFGLLIQTFEGLYTIGKPIFDGLVAIITPVVSLIGGTLINSIQALFDVIKDTFETISNSPLVDGIKKVFNSISETIKANIPSIESLKNVFKTVGDTINSLLPIITSLASGFAAYQVVTNAALIKTIAFETATKGMTIAQNAFNFVMGVGRTVITAVQTAIQFLASGQALAAVKTGVLAVAQKALNLVMSLNPIGAVVAVLGLLTGALVYAYQKSENFRNAVNNLYSKTLKPFIDLLEKGANAVANFLGFGDSKKETDKTKKNVQEIGKSFDELQKKANKLGNDFGTGLIDKETAQKNATDIAKEIEKAYSLKSITENNKKQLKAQLQQIVNFKKEAETTAGATTEKAKETKSLFETNKALLEIEKKRLSNEFTSLELSLKTRAESENRVLNENELFILKQKELKNQQSLLDSAKKLFEVTQDGANLEVGLKVKEIEKEEIKTTILDLNEKLIDTKITIGVAINKDIEEQIQSEIKDAANNIKTIENRNKEQLTVNYGLRVGTEQFATDIKKLQLDIENEKSKLVALLDLATDKQKEEINLQIGNLIEYQTNLLTNQNELLARVNIEFIQDRFKRERAISLFELEKKYKDEIAKIGENETRKNEIYLEFINKKREIDSKYNAESIGLYDTVVSNFVEGFVNSFNNLKIELPQVDVKKVDETKNKIAELQKQLDGLGKSDGELLSYEQFKDNEEQIKQELKNLTLELETETQKQGTLFENLAKAIQTSFVDSFKSIAENSKKSFENTIKDYEINSKNIIAIKENQLDIETELQKANDEGRTDDAEKLYDKLITSQSVLTAENKKNTELINLAYENTALSVAGSMASILATGKATIGDLALIMLDGLDSIIPVLTAQIFGLYAASPNPVNVFGLGVPGTVAAGAVTIALKALVALARAGIKGAEGGVIDLDSSYNQKPGRTDTIPFMLARGESVLTAKQTKEHYDFLQHIQNGGNERTYFVKKFKDSLKFDNISDVKLARNIRNVNGGVSTNILTLDNRNIEKGLNVLASLTKETNTKLNKLDNLERNTLIKGYNNHTINVNKKIVNEIKNNNYIG